jgi:hypothetical protein
LSLLFCGKKWALTFMSYSITSTASPPS